MHASMPPAGRADLSAELFAIPVGPNRFIVYAPLRRAAFVANSRVINFIADLKSGAAAAPEGDLLELLRQLEIVGAGAEAQPITQFAGDPEPTALTLFLTTACNLRCTYCYASAGDSPARSMPIEVARRGIDFVAGNAARKGASGFEIAYHCGGEPSVNWHTMTESMDYGRAKAAELGLQVSAAEATNGMLSEHQIDWMIANLDGVSLSFDGLPAAHDKHRITIDGRGSSTRIMHTLRRFDEARFRYGIRVTVTLDQIAALADGVDYICRNFKPERIQVEPAYQLGRWAAAPSAETEGFIEAYRQAQQRARAQGRDICYSAARLDTLTNHFCGITQDSFCLSPDGNVSACYESFTEQGQWAKVFFYGKPAEGAQGYRFDHERLNQLRSQAVQHRPHCRGCFAKWHCAGDCHHKALAVNGEGEFAGTERCHITRELTKDQIIDRIAASGGLFWHGPPDEAPAAAAGKELL
jgi:uncharacterized protein